MADDPEITNPRDPMKRRDVDVVAELDRWLGQWDSGYFAGAPSLETIPLVQRARDEIVALRGLLERHDRLVIKAVAVATPAIRDEALEEAAHECDEEAKASSEGFRDGCETCAAAIRTLKEKGT